MEKDYRDKIKKLLALAKSDNENEAKAALLKARELMAEHKLKEIDLQGFQNSKVVTLETGIMFTRRKNAWIAELTDIIADHHCCVSVMFGTKGRQQRRIVIYGLEQDAEICNTILKYAIECIESHNRHTRSLYRGYYPGADITRMCDHYGEGFTAGVQSMYEEQDRKTQEKAAATGYAIVLQVPQEVKDVTDDFTSAVFRRTDRSVRSRAEASQFTAGYADGMRFDPNKKLEEDQEPEERRQAANIA